jgi:hypothetical protein
MRLLRAVSLRCAGGYASGSPPFHLDVCLFPPLHYRWLRESAHVDEEVEILVRRRA